MLNPNRKGLLHYSDGEYKVLYRGCIHEYVMHLILFFFSIYGTFYSLNIFDLRDNYNINNLNKNNINQIIFILCKLISYISSAILHRYPFKSYKIQNLALKLDLISINISIFGTGWFYLDNHLHYLNYSKYLIALSNLSIYYENEFFRSIFTGAYVILTLNLIQYSTQFYYMWLFNVFCFVLGYFLYLSKFSKNKLILPWHKEGIYGYHEDFHFVLLLSDLSYFYMITHEN